MKYGWWVTLQAQKTLLWSQVTVGDLIRIVRQRCVCVCMQCHSPGVPGGAVEEFSSHAGADAGRKRLPGHWIPVREGELV